MIVLHDMPSVWKMYSFAMNMSCIPSNLFEHHHWLLTNSTTLSCYKFHDNDLILLCICSNKYTENIMVIMCAITRSLENKTSDSSQNVQYTDNTIKIRSIKIVVYIMPTIKSVCWSAYIVTVIQWYTLMIHCNSLPICIIVKNLSFV